MILEITSYRMLCELFAKSLTNSVRIAVSASGGIGKTYAAEAFASRHVDRVTIWRAEKQATECPALQDLLIASLSEEQLEAIKMQGRKPPVLDLMRYVKACGSLPDRFLVIVDDAQDISSRALTQIVSQTAEAGEIIGVGLVLLGDEDLSLPSSPVLPRPRDGARTIDAVKDRVLLGPTMTTRVLTGDDIMLMAESVGASPCEAANLRDLHEAGRIDPTFSEIRRHLRSSRRADRKGRPGQGTGIKSEIAPLC
jgi:hypothetical protein